MTDTVSDPKAVSFDLVKRISLKRIEVQAYLKRRGPRRRLLLNISLIGGSLSAILTAGPAMGGKSVTTWLSQTANLTSPSWQWLCGIASLLSIVAAISTQLLKSQRLEENLVKAQACAARLEVLEVSLAAQQIDLKQATTDFLQCVEAVAFLQGE